jgi:hypothetical protein
MTELNLGTLTVSLVDYPSGKSHGSANAMSADAISVAEAANRVTFPVSLPASVPAGFEVADAAHLSGPRDLIAITYEARGRGYFLLVKSANQPAAAGTNVQKVVGDSLKETTVGGKPAALVETDSRSGSAPAYLTLIWENGGVIEQLMGHGLPLEQLQEIAASIPGN